jgi:hypothetical protein
MAPVPSAASTSFISALKASWPEDDFQSTIPTRFLDTTPDSAVAGAVSLDLPTKAAAAQHAKRLDASCQHKSHISIFLPTPSAPAVNTRLSLHVQQI